MLSQYDDPAYALALLESGSEGRAYLLKERVHDGGQLVAAVEEVARGGSVIDSKIVESLVARPGRARTLAAGRAHLARAARCSPRSRRARATPRSPSRWS